MGIYQISRERMVQKQIKERGIDNPAVLQAMKTVPRHLFLPEAFIPQAYEDYPVPIGYGQTISQPFVVGQMSSLLEAEESMKVLEIGTGSGYQAAVLDAMGLEVYTIERIAELYSQACSLFMKLRYRKIKVKLADGTCGWEEHAPYDRIIVTAGGPSVPRPLLEQLADPGILLIPVGEERKEQELLRIHKENGKLHQERLGPLAFVDLVGRYAW